MKLKATGGTCNRQHRIRNREQTLISLMVCLVFVVCFNYHSRRCKRSMVLRLRPQYGTCMTIFLFLTRILNNAERLNVPTQISAPCFPFCKKYSVLWLVLVVLFYESYNARVPMKASTVYKGLVTLFPKAARFLLSIAVLYWPHSSHPVIHQACRFLAALFAACRRAIEQETKMKEAGVVPRIWVYMAPVSRRSALLWRPGTHH